MRVALVHNGWPQYSTTSLGRKQPPRASQPFPKSTADISLASQPAHFLKSAKEMGKSAFPQQGRKKAPAKPLLCKKTPPRFARMQHIQSVEGVIMVLPAPIRVRTNHPTHIVAPFPKNCLNILPITAKFLHFNEHKESKLLAAISLNQLRKRGRF